MKTNQNMVRRMGNFNVTQRTKDGYFDANELLSQWNGIESNPERKMNKFLKNKNTDEFLEALRAELAMDSQGANLPLPNNQLVIKGRARTDKRGRKIPASVWMHPYLFIKLAMWINPKFEVKVIKFVYDKLIQYRHEAGNAYKPFCNAIASISKDREVQHNITKAVKGLNYIVYNEHCRNIRNKHSSEDRLREMSELQKEVIGWINIGFINDYDKLQLALRKRYKEKYMPKMFID